MAGGFTYRGIDIATIGLEYAPELEDTYVYKTAKPRIHEETFDGHDGGYYYGTSREPKEFVLRCFFEQRDIDRGIMARIYSLFREGSTGRLIFDRRPWCYYYATVTELDTTGLTNYNSGTIRIVMKAYYPYARADQMTVKPQDKDYYRILENTAFFENEEMVPPVMFCQDGPITETTEILLSNPGSEYAPVGIEIAGNVGRGVVITNETTNQVCKFVAMSEEEFDGEMNFVYLDGLNGKTMAVKDDFKTTAFLYHDEGFITLAPGFPANRKIFVTTYDGVPKVTGKIYDRFSTDRKTAEDVYVGQHIWLGGWHEITGVPDEQTFELKTHPEYFNGKTMITRLNKIKIEPVSEMKLARLKFVYKPTFA